MAGKGEPGAWESAQAGSDPCRAHTSICQWPPSLRGELVKHWGVDGVLTASSLMSLSVDAAKTQFSVEEF